MPHKTKKEIVMEKEIKLQFNELKTKLLDLAKKKNVFKDFEPFMGEDKALSSASYMLRLKRLKAEKEATEPQVESLTNDFITVANEYTTESDNDEITVALQEIKNEIMGICEDINRKKIVTTSQVSSRLDVTTLKAINLDFIFDEIDSTYKFLNKQKVLKLTLQTGTLCNKKYKDCVKRNELINNIILNQLSMPYTALKTTEKVVKGRSRR